MRVVAVHSSPMHAFSKVPASEIELLAGKGVVGDAHSGSTVKHRSRVAKDPSQPNLRQVHLLHEELLAELQAKGFAVAPGQLGENITTRGLNLLGLSAGTKLLLGTEALGEITGLRNPCSQIEHFRSGLLAAVLDRSPEGKLIRKAGVMGVVISSGVVQAGTSILVAHTPAKHVALLPV